MISNVILTFLVFGCLACKSSWWILTLISGAGLLRMASLFHCGTLFCKLHKHVTSYLHLNVESSGVVNVNAFKNGLQCT